METYLDGGGSTVTEEMNSLYNRKSKITKDSEFVDIYNFSCKIILVLYPKEKPFLYHLEMVKSFNIAKKSFNPNLKTKFSTYYGFILSNELHRIKNKYVNNKNLVNVVAVRSGDISTGHSDDYIEGFHYSYNNLGNYTRKIEQKILFEDLIKFVIRISSLKKMYRDIKIIKLRYKGYTLKKIGNEVNLTRERVRIIINSTTKKFRISQGY